MAGSNQASANDQFEIPEDALEGAPQAKSAGKKSTRKKAEKTYTLRIDEEEGKPNFEVVGVNGKIWQLQRGVDIPNVPQCVIDVLKNAVMDVYAEAYDKEQQKKVLTKRTRSSVPWRIVG